MIKRILIRLPLTMIVKLVTCGMVEPSIYEDYVKQKLDKEFWSRYPRKFWKSPVYTDPFEEVFKEALDKVLSQIKKVIPSYDSAEIVAILETSMRYSSKIWQDLVLPKD